MMKNYSLNSDEAKKFILSYKIDNGKIIAKLASGELYIIPYSEKNEKTVISIMEKQARQAKPKSLNATDETIAVAMPSLLFLFIGVFVSNGGWFYSIPIAFTTVGTIYYLAKPIKNAIKKRDIKKLNYFLDHKEELNENVEKSRNMKLGISKRVFKEIEVQKSENKQPFTINNIDNYSLKDLKILKENIERISSFGFDEEEYALEDTMKEKGTVLKKTLGDKK